MAQVRSVEAPLYANRLWQMNQHEFAMQVEEVGSFYARDGKEVEYSRASGATRESLELYLNGSVYGAILHQRQVLPMHGSCFLEQGLGVMLCGESGAGKSSLTMAFCLTGGEFLTDDVTPVTIEDGVPVINALSDRIKLWDHTLNQLDISKTGLKRIGKRTDKFYLEKEAGSGGRYSLRLVINLAVGEASLPELEEVVGVARVAALRNEVYRWEYLHGMPENETQYFADLVSIAKSVKMFEVIRPVGISIKELVKYIREEIISKVSREE
ncbi:MAG TPA: hypothetical protein PLV06_14870 [Bacteroidales bacterium]|nr:hypothetical protein [Bacteroidales bacterium]HPR13667.1 hypothetical protein [Bacteroidales bacterium]